MIYIHVPFCHRKCTYCAFFSKVESGKWKVESFVDALIEEMRLRRGEQDHPIKTIYFGGGTPSILPLNHIATLTHALRDCFDLSQVEEVTMECNPEDMTDDFIHGIRELELVNRLSVGLQTMDDDLLRKINRRHTAEQAAHAVQHAWNMGFSNITIDLIYGICEGQDFEGVRPLLKYVKHVSAYSLTVEPGTALDRQVEQGRVVLPDEDEVVRQYYVLHEMLTAEGFVQYEVSNYARPGYESKHNSRYWNRTPYLGLGPGAHSFDGYRRRWNKPDGTFEEELLTEADAIDEMLMTSLRTTAGLSLLQVPERYKKTLHQGMQRYVDCGWLTLEDGFYRPTTEGLLHADGMALGLLVV